ncbi:tetratricopeptide repeat protein [bacterium]|nr:MAG: tetratricopeptide repeat protein [bacterium]
MNNFSKNIYSLPVFVLLITVLFADLVSAQVGLSRRQADKLFESGDHYHAMQSYKQLLDENPDDPELNYNVGNSLYRMQMYDQAKLYYEKALANASDSKLKNNIQYNIANCEYKSKKLKESIEGYKQVLRKNPEDADARKNLELALKQMQKQNPPPQKNDDKNQSKKDQQKDEQDKDKEDKKQDETKDQRNEDRNDQKKQSETTQGMNKKEAEKLLDALKNQDKDYQKKKIKEKVTKEQKTEKDW